MTGRQSIAEIIFQGVDQTQAATRSVVGGLSRVQSETGKLQGVLGSLAGGVGIGVLLGIAHGAIEAGDAVATLAKKLGLGATTVSALKFAADQSETSIERLGDGLKFLGRNMVENAQEFAAIGVATRGADGALRRVDDVLLDVADIFARLPDGAQKTALAMQLFGRSGNELISFLSQGSAGIRALMEEARRLGVVMSDDFANAADQFKDNLAKVQAGVGGLAQGALGPGLKLVADNFDAIASSAGAAAVIVGSLFAGRMVAAVVAYTQELGRNAVAHFATAAAARAAAQQQVIAAEAVLANAQRQAALLSGLHKLTFAQMTLIPATRNLEVAQLAAAAAGTRMAAAAGVARGAIAFLGGPIGVITTIVSLGAAAWALWGNKAESAAEKAKRKLKETGDKATEILERLAKEQRFGTGDLGILQEERARVEGEIDLYSRVANLSEQGKARLAGLQQRYDDLTQGITKLESAERGAGDAANVFGKAMKEANDAARKGAEETLKAYDALRQALSHAFQEGLEKAKALRDEAASLRLEIATSKPVPKKPEDDIRATRDVVQKTASAGLDLGIAEQKLARLAATGVPIEELRKQVDLVDKLAERYGRFAAAQEDAFAAQQIEERATTAGANAKELLAKALDKEAASKESSAQQQAKLLNDLESKLDTLRQKAGDIPVNLDIRAAEAALDRLAARMANAVPGRTTPGTWGSDANGTFWNLDTLPQRAGGGPIRGPGGPTDDRVLMWGSAGEWVMRAAAVRHYGLGVMAAINNLRLPKFAAGGEVGGQPINLFLEGGGPFSVSASPAVGEQLLAFVRREALKRGKPA